MTISFTHKALDELLDPRNEKAFNKRLRLLFDDMRRDPFTGRGKPEPLKHDLAGCWSRRIDDKDRLVYCVVGDQIQVISLRSHYGDH